MQIRAFAGIRERYPVCFASWGSWGGGLLSPGQERPEQGECGGFWPSWSPSQRTRTVRLSDSPTLIRLSMEERERSLMRTRPGKVSGELAPSRSFWRIPSYPYFLAHGPPSSFNASGVASRFCHLRLSSPLLCFIRTLVVSMGPGDDPQITCLRSAFKCALECWERNRLLETSFKRSMD